MKLYSILIRPHQSGYSVQMTLTREDGSHDYSDSCCFGTATNPRRFDTYMDAFEAAVAEIQRVGADWCWWEWTEEELALQEQIRKEYSMTEQRKPEWPTVDGRPMRLHEWHYQQCEKARDRVTALKAHDDLDPETRKRRMRRWADIGDWHEDRAHAWQRWGDS